MPKSTHLVTPPERIPTGKKRTHDQIIGTKDPDNDSNEEYRYADAEEENERTGARPYQVLLESLILTTKDKQRNSKKPKIGLAQEQHLERHGLELGHTNDMKTQDEKQKPNDSGGLKTMSDDDEEESAEGFGTTDPFENHFYDPSPQFLGRINSVQKNEWDSKKVKLSRMGRSLLSVPRGSDLAHPPNIEALQDLKIKQRLMVPFTEINHDLTLLQKELMPYMFSYHDVVFTSRSTENADELRKTYCLHALNHIFKTRDRVIRNNARLSRENDLEFRDQGFTRPKVLIVLPTKNTCVQVVECLVSLSGTEQQENKKRFQESYTLPPSDDRISRKKPQDFLELFAGNQEDSFRLGVKFTRKNMKFFSPFYSSDIILTSPLGLRMAIGNESEQKTDFDFLSSIEVVIMDQTDALLCQNWDHVEHVFKHLNLIPKEPHGCDFGRVKNWYLDNNSKYLRQTVILSQFTTPEVQSTITNYFQNIAGILKSQPEYGGVIMDLGMPIRQTFIRFESPNPVRDPEARFNHFKFTIMPFTIRNIHDGGLLMFVHSYFDFVRVRNYLQSQQFPFGVISEESSASDVARTRSYFLSGRHSVLLYTGRAHHFWRHEIRGVKDVILYSLPDNPLFYKEIVGGYMGRSVGEGLIDGGRVKAKVLFSKWDIMKLERVVGTGRVRIMCTDVGDAFEFE